jgi:hypothetical protein
VSQILSVNKVMDSILHAIVRAALLRQASCNATQKARKTILHNQLLTVRLIEKGLWDIQCKGSDRGFSFMPFESLHFGIEQRVSLEKKS